jgi:peptide chain release factor 3
MITTKCPGPKEREAKLPPYDVDSKTRFVSPEEEKFTGFVFKIQANMDKKHRDRMSFFRVCSGKFNRGNKLFCVRTGKEVKINSPIIFQSRDRDITDEAYAGDIIGFSGHFQIGDTLTEGEKMMFTGIPSFAPEIFMKIILKDPLKAKHLEKGLMQLSEEGAVQLFTRLQGNERVMGAVGMLQFDVVKFRLEDEYNVRGDYVPFPMQGIRWLRFSNKKVEKTFCENYHSNIMFDRNGNICYCLRDAWELKMIMEKNKEVEFFNNSDFRS